MPKLSRRGLTALAAAFENASFSKGQTISILEAVLARQQMMIGGLMTSRVHVARELAALRRVPTTPQDTPAYLDVEG